jgi:decaprenylphospho-beta-D-ribofuranose 2-oxidase
MSSLSESDERYSHTVAWIDLSGDFRGRGIVSKANYYEGQYKPYERKLSNGISVPFLLDVNYVKPTSVRLFNEAWFRKPVRNGQVDLYTYMHPLDGVSNWNRIYGKYGFVQYQFVLPYDKERIIEQILQLIRKSGGASFLGVLKKFGESGKSFLGFPKKGWSLAIDLPSDLPGLEILLNKIDEILVSEGGRIYLVKDSRMKPELVPLMYKDLGVWRTIRDEMDPNGIWKSDQARRLQLC